MNFSTAYTLQNVLGVLIAVSKLKQRGILVVSQLLSFVETELDATYGKETHRKYICVRLTFDRYLELAGQVQLDQCPDLRPFRHAMRAIREEAYRLIIEYCKKIDPNIFDR